MVTQLFRVPIRIDAKLRALISRLFLFSYTKSSNIRMWQSFLVAYIELFPMYGTDTQLFHAALGAELFTRRSAASSRACYSAGQAT